jgi:23S rRNA (cytosine1962-C5)-methyltransferase
MKKFRIDDRSSQRVQQTYPWVFSNELLDPAKSIVSGEIYQLCNKKNQFIAYAYGNPHSLISFRVLSRKENENIDDSFILEKLKQAALLRLNSGYKDTSFRLCFGEVDGLPGLLVDCYKIFGTQQRVIVFQITTLGMQNLLSTKAKQIFLQLAQFLNWNSIGLIERKDSRGRKLEQLPIIEEADCLIDSNSSLDRVGIETLELKSPLYCSLLGGQKGGLFLDQQDNLGLFKKYLTQSFSTKTQLKMLDMFCYVGQWSKAASEALNKSQWHFDLADVSKNALEYASLNLTDHSHKKIEINLLKEIKTADFHNYDVVICDPPALIQSKKDISLGKRAYLKTIKEAMKATNHHSLLVVCSCSQHLSENDLLEIIVDAQAKVNKNFNVLAQGQQGRDHPRNLTFQQSYYLKCFFLECLPD